MPEKEIRKCVERLCKSIHLLSDKTSSSCQKCFALKCFGPRFLICCDLTLFTVKAKEWGKVSRKTEADRKRESERNHPIWCSQSDCWPLVIFAQWGGFQRGILQMRIGWWATEPAPAFSLLWAMVPPSFPVNDVLIPLFLCISVQCCVPLCF